MHAGDEHLLVVGPVDGSYSAAFREITHGAPQKIMFQFAGARMLEAERLAALGVDPRHDVLDGPILPRRIHRLKKDEQRVAVRRVEELLLRAQLATCSARTFLYCSNDL